MTRFDLAALDDRSALQDFRFTVHEIQSRLVPFVASGEKVRTGRNRYWCDSILATCVVLRRLASPARWVDLEVYFGKHRSQLSEIFWEALEGMIDKRRRLVMDWREELMQERAELYASYTARVSALQNCVGYLDCTKVKVSRPGGSNANQRALYSGHKRTWCLKFQTVSTPDGLIFHLYGPEDGRRHDTTLYAKSNLDLLLQNGLSVGATQFCLYADQAYILRPWLQVGFHSIHSTGEQGEFNSCNNVGRTAVEWSYKDVRQAWTTVDFQRKMKVRESPVALQFIGSVLLWNIKVILGHGCQTQSFFTDNPEDLCSPPTWDEYLAVCSDE